MQLKKAFNISLYFIICILIIAAGIRAFTQLKSQKETYNINLFSLIPNNATLIIRIFEAQKFYEHSSDFSFLLPDSSLINITDLLSEESILSFHPQGSLLFSKPDRNDYEILSGCLQENNPVLFLKQEYHNGVKLFIIPSTNNEFFCYSFHKGIFIGSHNKKLLEHAIDLYTKNGNAREDSTLNACINKSNNKAQANLFIRKTPFNLPFGALQFNNWTGCNIETNGQDLIITGMMSQNQPDNLIHKIITQSTGLCNSPDKRFIPEDLTSFSQLNIDTLALSDIIPDSLLRRALEGEIGIYNFANHNVGFFKIKPQNINNFLDSCRKEKRSPQTGEPSFWVYNRKPSFVNLFSDRFNPDSILFLTMYDKYLLFGDKKKHIIQYINQLSKSDSIFQQCSLPDLSKIYQTETGITYWKTTNHYDLFLLLYKKNDILFFNIIVRKSTADF